MRPSIFQSRQAENLSQLASGQFSSSQERDQLLAQIVADDSLRSKDVIWMLFRPDRAIREAGTRLLQRQAEPEIVDFFLEECRGKASAALRSAAEHLFRVGVPNLERRLIELGESTDGETRDRVRRLLLDAPATPGLEAALWRLASEGSHQERSEVLKRLALFPLSPQGLKRWQKIASDGEPDLRETALTVLAAGAPEAAADLLLEELPRVSHAVRQRLATALAQVASAQGPDFADRVLPLMASSDPGVRASVLSVLLGLPDRREVVRRYLIFAKTLAGWARDRALESMKAFGEDLLEPTIELLQDPDEDVRSAAMAVAACFDDPRIVPASVRLLQDPDWWIRITAADTLGRLGDRRAVEPLIAALDDTEVRWAAVEALGRIGDPRALPSLAKLLRDPAADIRIEVILALRNFRHPNVRKVLEQVAASDGHRSVRTRALEIAEEVASREGETLSEPEKLRTAALRLEIGSEEPGLHALLAATRRTEASDLHIAVGEPATMRLASELVRMESDPLTAADTQQLIREILDDEQWRQLETEQYLDFCYHVPSAGRYRGNVFVDRKGYQAVFRVIPEKPPTIAEIGLPEQLAGIADHHQGLVLVCGPGGSGKSTTLSALVNLFNETRSGHIITLEDPVEFVHPFKNCLVNQRQIGSHSDSFARAIRAALREDPDVIVIGELRDNESISQALIAAETGHVVLATLNSTSSAKAVERIISSFPLDDQPQVRTSLSECLDYVIAQRLLPASTKGRLVACFEILRGTLSVANLIRDQKTYQIQSVLQIGQSRGMQSFDDALRKLVQSQRISPETAYLAARNKEDFEPLVSTEFLERRTFL